MRHGQLKDMVRGWFVGGFRPTLLDTEACEVAVKTYAAGETEAAHFHRIGTEVTVIVSGRVRMFGRDWGEGDIVVAEPGDVTDFLAHADAVTVVVKVPGARDDKYLA